MFVYVLLVCILLALAIVIFLLWRMRPAKKLSEAEALKEDQTETKRKMELQARRTDYLMQEVEKLSRHVALLEVIAHKPDNGEKRVAEPIPFTRPVDEITPTRNGGEYSHVLGKKEKSTT